MWMVNSHISKAVVWLAAALLPADILSAGNCGCNDQSTGNANAKSVETHQAAGCCCSGGAVCQCKHKIQKVEKSACCKNHGVSLNSSSPVVQVCVCPGNKTPVSKTT